MRWNRFFDDLEGQLATEWDAERAALDSEEERLRLARVTLRDRLAIVCDAGALVALDVADDTVLRARVRTVGADWVAVEPEGGGRGGVILPLWAILGVGLPTAGVAADRGEIRRPALTGRMTFGYVLRDLARRREGVALTLASGRILTGTIDLVGADHLELALHDAGAARRADAVTGRRLIPFPAVAGVRVSAAVAY